MQSKFDSSININKTIFNDTKEKTLDIVDFSFDYPVFDRLKLNMLNLPHKYSQTIMGLIKMKHHNDKFYNIGHLIVDQTDSYHELVYALPQHVKDYKPRLNKFQFRVSYLKTP